jgi:Tfp pilus assembly protein PilZ
MEKRRQHRVAKNLLARITTTTASFFAYVQDLAKVGVCFSCNNKLANGEEVQLALNMPSRPTMALKGRVVWTRSLPSISKNKYQYGVRLIEPMPEYLRVVEELIKRDFERRKHSRFLDVLVVEAKDVLDLLDASTVDISAGGLYIGSNRPLEMGAQYTLKLFEPNMSAPIYCLVEVVVVYDTTGEEFDHPYGAGVRFISFADDGEKRLTQYIRSLETLYRYHWPSDAAAGGDIE